MNHKQIATTQTDDSKIIRVEVGKYHSRGLFSPSNGRMPAIIMIPGSGPNGPEEMIPAAMTVDLKDHSIFDSIRKPFTQANWNVLSLGKTGIEFHTSWDQSKFFYDKSLYMSLRWAQLIENLDEGITFLRQQPSVDPERIYILGHSQGTQVAIDFSSSHGKGIAGLILIGFSGEDYKTILDWQIFKRPVEHFVATDVDKNHDGFVTKEDASKWPGPFNLDDSKFDWNFRPGKDKLSYAEIEEDLRNNPENSSYINTLKKAPFLSGGIFDRGPIYKRAASLKIPIYVYTGELDLLTPPRESLELKKACDMAGKSNCEIRIVPGLGHGFSPPRGPRAHPLLDITVGPVTQSFIDEIVHLIRRLDQTSEVK